MSTQSPLTRSGPQTSPADLEPPADPGTGTATPAAVRPLPRSARMSWPRRIFAGLFVLALVAVAVASLRPRPPPPLVIQASPARRGSITRVVTAAGKLQAATEVKLSANVSGDLLELDAHEGDRVKKGQVLGKIDAQRYSAQVSQQEAARASAAADVDGERVRVAQLEQELRRAEKLAQTGNASGAEVDNARSSLEGERAR